MASLGSFVSVLPSPPAFPLCRFHIIFFPRDQQLAMWPRTMARLRDSGVRPQAKYEKCASCCNSGDERTHPNANLLTDRLAERHTRSSTYGRVENPGSHQLQLRLLRGEEKLMYSFWMDNQEPQSSPPRPVNDGHSHPTFHASESHHSNPPSSQSGPSSQHVKRLADTLTSRTPSSRSQPANPRHRKMAGLVFPSSNPQHSFWT